MALVKMDTGFNIEVDFAIAPFHKRFFAWIIDLLIQWVLVKLLTLIFGLYQYFTVAWGDGDNGWTFWTALSINLLILFYHLICEISFNGRSPGKMAMNIRVITSEGGQPSLGQYLLRWAFRIIDFPVLFVFAIATRDIPVYFFPIIFVGLATVIFTPMSQRIGDLVAGTIIIDLRNRTSWEDTVFTEVESTYQPKYPQVMQLSDRDINTLKSIIENVRKKNNYDLSLRIADRIKSKLKLESDQNSLEFLETLLKDYNYYSVN